MARWTAWKMPGAANESGTSDFEFFNTEHLTEYDSLYSAFFFIPRSGATTIKGYYYEKTLYYNSTVLGTAKSLSTEIPKGILSQHPYTTFTQGSNSDLWGATLTPATANDESFGYALKFRRVADADEDISHRLVFTDYGFEIPTGETILGVQTSMSGLTAYYNAEKYGVFYKHPLMRICYTGDPGNAMWLGITF